jgi:hypothetical protein
VRDYHTNRHADSRNERGERVEDPAAERARPSANRALSLVVPVNAGARFSGAFCSRGVGSAEWRMRRLLLKPWLLRV